MLKHISSFVILTRLKSALKLGQRQPTTVFLVTNTLTELVKALYSLTSLKKGFQKICDKFSVLDI